MLQEQARDYSVKMGDDDIKTIDGWLESFKKRHNSSSKEICGEARDVSRQWWTGNKNLHIMLDELCEIYKIHMFLSDIFQKLNMWFCKYMMKVS